MLINAQRAGTEHEYSRDVLLEDTDDCLHLVLTGN